MLDILRYSLVLDDRLLLRAALLTLTCLGTLAGCDRTHPGSQVAASNLKAASEVAAPVTDAEVQQFCGRCHAVPDPLSVPREEWWLEVEQGFRFHAESDWSAELAPDKAAVVAYFESRARFYKDFPQPSLAAPDSTRVRFHKTTVELGSREKPPVIVGLRWLDLATDSLPQLFVTHVREGGLLAVRPGRTDTPAATALVQPGSALLSDPCQVAPCDLNGDRLTDLVVADLGKFYASDESLGRIAWLRQTPKHGFQAVEIASRLGRVADMQPGDFDGDGRQDLVVAEFGWRTKGSIILLKNRGLQQGVPRFESVTIDRRHGAIHVPVCDLNQDGKLDFIALISQEHEVIEAFLGNGDGTFQARRIYAAPHPSWGSSGIQVVDFDADGDLDVLFSNGDHFDRPILKPYHAAQWLENGGDFPWIHHQLAPMPGCHRVLAGDIDGDGDQDAVAVAYLDAQITDRFGADNFASVAWFEQTEPRVFQQHVLQRGDCRHLTLELADFDADGDVDLAVPTSLVRPRQDEVRPPASLTIWWNEAADASPPPPTGE